VLPIIVVVTEFFRQAKRHISYLANLVLPKVSLPSIFSDFLKNKQVILTKFVNIYILANIFVGVGMPCGFPGAFPGQEGGMDAVASTIKVLRL
jgi:hypothetical protein